MAEIEEDNIANNAGEENQSTSEDTQIQDVRRVSELYEDWFLDYASYVILERAVPAIEDGLKPVQRRILHAMNEMDDGRYNKVANIIGQTMQYHPHGDAAIGDAMVNLGQKDLLIDTQGNWGDSRTGDSAAASRYIEARLSKFAKEIAFNPQTTVWQMSYDGRKREPVNLPMKFPLLLAQGVEGIAVGLSTKVLPHNFIEIIEACVAHLKGQAFALYPDFATGGMVDVGAYNDGKKGSRLRIRAHIEERDKKTLIIKDVPYGVTTTSLMESIVKANDSGKIKIKRVVDNTAANVEIEIQLHPGTSPDITIDALYAFTECEVSVSPNACVIENDKPVFLSVSEILQASAEMTRALLRKEQEIKKGELDERWHFSSLEKIFIEKRIYRKIEECETWESVLETIDKGLKPYKKLFRREITRDDIIRLTEIRIKRISKYDSFKADEAIRALEEEMERVAHNLNHITQFTIDYYKELLKKFGKGRERKTQISQFDTINATVVAIANQKLYVNREEGFVGYGLKRDEFVTDCSDLDDVIVFKEDGSFVVSRVAEKSFFGKKIKHVAILKKGDDRMVYHMMYTDGKTGVTRAKRFRIGGVTRDKVYQITLGTPNTRVLFFSENPNSESETVQIQLSPAAKAKNKVFDFDFGSIEVKGRASQGNIVTKYPVRKVNFKSKGASTMGGRDIWYDPIVGRINVNQHGNYLGNFQTDDLILVIYKSGSYELTNFELTNRYEAAQVEIIEKWLPNRVITAVHYDGTNKTTYVKRFVIETRTLNKKFSFINEAKGSRLYYVTTLQHPKLKIWKGTNMKSATVKILQLDNEVEQRGWKANGNKIASLPLLQTEAQPANEAEEEAALKKLMAEAGGRNSDEAEPIEESPASEQDEAPEAEKTIQDAKAENRLTEMAETAESPTETEAPEAKAAQQAPLKKQPKGKSKKDESNSQLTIF